MVRPKRRICALHALQQRVDCPCVVTGGNVRIAKIYLTGCNATAADRTATRNSVLNLNADQEGSSCLSRLQQAEVTSAWLGGENRRN